MTASQIPATAGELRGAGLRVTAARVALLEVVRDGDHLGVEAIAAGVRGRRGALPDRVRGPRLLDRRGRGHLLGPVPRLFHCHQFLGAVTRLSGRTEGFACPRTMIP